MPSDVIEMKSRVPLIGLTTMPATPCAAPLKKPKMPPLSPPSIGFVTNPVTPEPIELIADLNPRPKPYSTFLGFCLIVSTSL